MLSTGARWRQMNVPGEARISQQGRGLLPALRRPAVQGQARGGDRRRQFRRRGGDRPRRHRGPCHADRVRRAIARRRGAAGQAALRCANVTRHRLGPDHRSAWRRRKGDRPCPTRTGSAARRIASISKAYSSRSASLPNTEWLKGAIDLSPRGEIEIDARGADLRSRRVRRRRRHDRALQADRHRHGRRRQGGAFGLRLPDPHARDFRGCVNFRAAAGTTGGGGRPPCAPDRAGASCGLSLSAEKSWPSDPAAPICRFITAGFPPGSASAWRGSAR